MIHYFQYLTILENILFYSQKKYLKNGTFFLIKIIRNNFQEETKGKIYQYASITC